MSALLRKKARRQGLREYLKTIQEIYELINESVTEAKLLGIKGTLLNAVQNLSAVDEEILISIDVDEVTGNVVESLQIIEPLNEKIAQLDLKIEKMRVSSQSERSLNLGSCSSSSSQHLKLPKYDLPVFSGDALNWQGFWDQFDVSVHSKEALSDIDRPNYLKRYLRGEALSAVSGLSLCSDNYKEVVKVLRQHICLPR